MFMTPTDWQRYLRDKKGVHAMACELQRQLKGYRQNSLDRATDVDNITNALQGAMMLAREEACREMHRPEEQDASKHTNEQAQP